MSSSTEHGESHGERKLGATTEPSTRRTIGPEEFDPLGTLLLISLYFLVLIVMWLFTYFVEFVGNDPTPMILL